MPSPLINAELLTLSHEQLLALTPYGVTFLGGILGILFSSTRKLNPKWLVFLVSLLSCVCAAFFAWQGLSGMNEATTTPLFGGMMVVDSYSNFFNLIFLMSAVFSMFAAFRYLDQERIQYPEFYVLMMLSALGMMLMASALNLIVIFIALEIMSLAVYVLVGFRRFDRRSNEASLKYFIMGAVASAVLLYGSAFLYGVTGTLDLRVMIDFVKAHPGVSESPLFALGVWLVVSGFLFKVASVPFHMWMPDVYEGAPVPVTGFMTTGLKAASFAAFVRVLITLGYGRGFSEAFQNHIHDILWICAVITMVVGNLVALTQVNLKRMLGYSSIAHTGYLLMGLLVSHRSEQAISAVLVYLVAYAAMNLGAFILLSILAAREDSGLNLHDLSGLGQRRPLLALSMAVFLFSMAGIPPTAGFLAKYLLFYSAIQSGEIVLTVIAVLCSAISVYYYLRVLVMVYMHEPAEVPSAQPRASGWALAALACTVVLTLQIGVAPNLLLEAAKRAVTHF